MNGRRVKMIAVGAAVLAVILAAIATVVTLTRTPEVATGPAVDDGTITASELVAASTVAISATNDGVAFAVAVPALGVRTGDVVLAIAGHTVASREDVLLALTELAVGPASATVYVELRRDGVPLLVRRRVTGDVHDEWLAIHSPPPRPSPPIFTPPPITPPSGILDPFGTLAPPPPPPPDPDVEALRAGVMKIDDWHFSVDRKALDKVLGTQTFMRSARMVPAVRDGKPNGFKIYAIRPSSPFGILGFANGDTIQRVNGLELTTAESALEAYTKLKNAKTLVVEIMRRGKPVTQTYTIH